MKPEEHNRLLAIGHFIQGGFYSLFFLMFMAMAVLFAFIDPPTKPGEEFPNLFFAAFMGIFSFVYLFLGLPSIIAGYGLLKRKSWAKTWAIIGGVLAGFNFPIGVAVCVYTFWFMFSEPGKTLYDNPTAQTSKENTQGLYGAPTFSDWTTAKEQTKTKDYEFHNPSQPPNWRE